MSNESLKKAAKAAIAEWFSPDFIVETNCPALREYMSALRAKLEREEPKVELPHDSSLESVLSQLLIERNDPTMQFTVYQAALQYSIDLLRGTNRAAPPDAGRELAEMINRYARTLQTEKGMVPLDEDYWRSLEAKAREVLAGSTPEREPLAEAADLLCPDCAHYDEKGRIVGCELSDITVTKLRAGGTPEVPKIDIASGGGTVPGREITPFEQQQRNGLVPLDYESKKGAGE